MTGAVNNTAFNQSPLDLLRRVTEAASARSPWPWEGDRPPGR